MSSCFCTGQCKLPGGSCPAYPAGHGNIDDKEIYTYTRLTSRLSQLEKWCNIGYKDLLERVSALEKRPFSYKELLDKVAELSIKINEHYSQMREFEKQRVTPKFEELDRIKNQLQQEIIYIDERIEKIEKIFYDVLEKGNKVILEPKENNINKILEENQKLILQRLIELEEWTRADEDKIYKRLKDLEESYRGLSAELLHVMEERDKRPYKCPVCDGSGGLSHPLTGLLQQAICKSCEGKGIVWG